MAAIIVEELQTISASRASVRVVGITGAAVTGTRDARILIEEASINAHTLLESLIPSLVVSTSRFASAENVVIVLISLALVHASASLIAFVSVAAMNTSGAVPSLPEVVTSSHTHSTVEVLVIFAARAARFLLPVEVLTVTALSSASKSLVVPLFVVLTLEDTLDTIPQLLELASKATLISVPCFPQIADNAAHSVLESLVLSASGFASVVVVIIDLVVAAFVDDADASIPVIAVSASELAQAVLVDLMRSASDSAPVDIIIVQFVVAASVGDADASIPVIADSASELAQAVLVDLMWSASDSAPVDIIIVHFVVAASVGDADASIPVIAVFASEFAQAVLVDLMRSASDSAPVDIVIVHFMVPAFFVARASIPVVAIFAS
jgi:hypothetical protein